MKSGDHQEVVRTFLTHPAQHSALEAIVKVSLFRRFRGAALFDQNWKIEALIDSR